MMPVNPSQKRFVPSTDFVTLDFQAWWHMPVIPALRRWKLEGSVVQCRPELQEILSQKKKSWKIIGALTEHKFEDI